MSELYTDPKELKKQLGRHKTGNFLQDSFTDWVSSGLSIGDDGQVKREGAAFWLQGLTPGAEQLARTKEQLEEATAVRNAVVRSGLDDQTISETAGGRKLTADNVTGILNTAKINYQTPAQKKAAALEAKQINSSIALAEAQQTFQQTQLQSQEAWQREQQRNRWEDKRDQRKENALTREMNAQNNAMQMQLEYSRLAQQDRQNAQDRRDKAIMMLMQGLGNLGSAFTI